MDEIPVVHELSAAVERSPDAVELRLHLAGLLADKGRYTEALSHCSVALTQDAGNLNALSLLQHAGNQRPDSYPGRPLHRKVSGLLSDHG